MYGGDYIWIMQHQQEKWWEFSEEKDECSAVHLNQATDGLVLVSDLNTDSDNEVSEPRMNQTYLRKSIMALSTNIISTYIDYVYDAVWAIALALRGNRLIECNKSIYYYEDRRPAVQQFMNAMESINFLGLSGPVKFVGPDRVGDTLLTQIQGGKSVRIAIYDSRRNKLTFDCRNCFNISWMYGRVPVAQRLLKVVVLRVPVILYYIVCSFLRFRRVKNLKLFSPTLNNVAVCGCICVYCSVILMGTDEVFEVTQKYFTEVCTAKAYLLSSGFSMVFGSIFAKTYRVHKLFNNCRTSVVKTRFLKDKLLIIFILFPMMIDAIILILWIVVDPMQRRLHNLTIETFYEIGVAHQKQVEFCGSNNTSGWYLALYGYKCFMVIIGIFMAWENRRLKIPSLDDFQYIGICVYSALFAAIMLILSNFLAENVILSYLTSSCSVILAASLTLLLLFLPQFKIILGTVKNDDLIMRSMGLKFECNTRRLIHKDQKELLHRLEIQNRVFKCELEVLDEEIKYLENLLKSSNNSKESTSDIYTISKPNYLKMPDSTYGRASWPTSYIQSSSNEHFSSENRLNETFFERLRIFGRLKKFLDSLSSVSDSESKKSMEDGVMPAQQMDDWQHNRDDTVVSMEVRQISQVHSDAMLI
ncbi:hypothetical protein WA026_012408 [Henosepilachna vigintioctopunctata]|uniref:G-protein coupled receptors family 3 profile domain-containing protein n=1 Tax=Henosepilachna vigintioctopunctata TaxID=420089 RepID=A0AAW1V196_9CUCU